MTNADTITSWRSYAWAFASVALAWVIGMLTQSFFASANLVMLFLLAVVASAYWLGRGPAVFSAVLGVAVFDFFFVPPAWSFAVADAQYLVTFAVMLLTGLAITVLASGLRRAGDESRLREKRTQDLYRFAQTLSGAPSQAFVIEASYAYFDQVHRAPVTLLLPDAAGVLRTAEDRGGELSGLSGAVRTSHAPLAWDMNVARAVYATTTVGRTSRPGVRSDGFLYLALRAPLRTRGVMVVAAQASASRAAPDIDDADFATAATLLALALERVHLVEVAHQVTLEMENERLRNTLLASLSHDLRTPLTAILGSADALRLHGNALGQECLSLAEAISHEARRTSRLVENILDMARLESGSVSMELQWHSLAEIASAAAVSRASILCGRQVALNFAPNFPLVSCDAVLIERLLVNLIENAAKFSPAGSPIEVGGDVERGGISGGGGAAGGNVTMTVRDHGPGIATGAEESIFRKFVRGEGSQIAPGLGLGLAICKAIVEAHRGKISAANHHEGGTVIRVSLPLGHSPDLPTLPEVGL